jgi:hypothetical protein
MACERVTIERLRDIRAPTSFVGTLRCKHARDGTRLSSTALDYMPDRDLLNDVRGLLVHQG